MSSPTKDESKQCRQETLDEAAMIGRLWLGGSPTIKVLLGYPMDLHKCILSPAADETQQYQQWAPGSVRDRLVLAGRISNDLMPSKLAIRSLYTQIFNIRRGKQAMPPGAERILNRVAITARLYLVGSPVIKILRE